LASTGVTALIVGGSGRGTTAVSNIELLTFLLWSLFWVASSAESLCKQAQQG
jgi:hypothetical protein